MEKINKASLKNVLGEIVKVLDEKKDYLIELDGAMGDGDLGLTMTTGFRTIFEEVDKIDSDDMGSVLMKLGMKMNSTVASTMGTLISICLIKAAKEVKGVTEIGLSEAAKMGEAAINGVTERGKAKVGDRTMLDALYPAVEALKKAAEENKSMAEAHADAFEAAIAGVEKTKEMKPVHGRAAYYVDKSQGVPDSGAVAIMFIFNGLANSFK